MEITLAFSPAWCSPASGKTSAAVAYTIRGYVTGLTDKAYDQLLARHWWGQGDEDSTFLFWESGLGVPACEGQGISPATQTEACIEAGRHIGQTLGVLWRLLP